MDKTPPILDYRGATPDRGSRPVLPLLNYRPATPAKLSGVSYFRVVTFASIQLIFTVGLAIFALFALVGGIAGLYFAGQANDLACAGVVWGPILLVLAIWWFLQALEVLAAGRNYNPNY